MLKSVGYIGYGFVGKACHEAFKHNAEAIIVDPKYSTTTINELVNKNPPLVFVSINAPTCDDRSIDAHVIYDVFTQLSELKYPGLVVLKSTLTPDIVDDLHNKFGKDLRYIYSPEFLREWNWQHDAVNPHMIIMAGNFMDCKVLEDLYENHSHIKSTRFVLIDYKAAALFKYTINSYLASKVVFMNQIYKVFSDIYGKDPSPEDWNAFTQVLSTDPRIGNSHLAVPGPDGNFGYGGNCFPKDVKAFIGIDKFERLTVLREVEVVNTQIRLTGENNGSRTTKK